MQNGCEAIDVVAVASLIVAVVVLFPCLLLSFCFSGGGGSRVHSMDFTCTLLISTFSVKTVRKETTFFSVSNNWLHYRERGKTTGNYEN